MLTSGGDVIGPGALQDVVYRLAGEDIEILTKGSEVDRIKFESIIIR